MWKRRIDWEKLEAIFADGHAWGTGSLHYAGRYCLIGGVQAQRLRAREQRRAFRLLATVGGATADQVAHIRIWDNMPQAVYWFNDGVSGGGGRWPVIRDAIRQAAALDPKYRRRVVEEEEPGPAAERPGDGPLGPPRDRPPTYRFPEVPPCPPSTPPAPDGQNRCRISISC